MSGVLLILGMIVIMLLIKGFLLSVAYDKKKNMYMDPSELADSSIAEYKKKKQIAQLLKFRNIEQIKQLVQYHIQRLLAETSELGTLKNMATHPNFKPAKSYKSLLKNTLNNISDHSMKLAVYIQMHYKLFEEKGPEILKKRKQVLKELLDPFMKFIWECDNVLQEKLDVKKPEENLVRISTKKYFESISIFLLEDKAKLITGPKVLEDLSIKKNK